MHSLDTTPDTAWEQITPHLEEAMSALGDQDRLAVLLRFFQRKPLKDVGEALGISEDAARMRLNRALDRLRDSLAKKGVVCSSVVLGAGLTERAVQAAPVWAAELVQTAALEAAKAAGVPSFFKTILSLMAKAKLKTAVIMGVALLVTADLGLYLHNQSQERSREQAQPSATPPTVTGGLHRRIPQLAAPATPADPAPELQDLIAKLRAALHEEPVVGQVIQTPDALWEALRAFGPDIQAAFPVLLEGLQDSNDTVRECSIYGFQFLGRQADETIPTLIDLLRAEAQPLSTRVSAMEALKAIAMPTGSPPADAAEAGAIAVVVPELINCLKEGNVQLRKQAAVELGTMGSYAKDAVPAIAELLAYSASPDEARAEASDRQLSGPGSDATTIGQEREKLTSSVRHAAVKALEWIGPDAQTAVPSLSLRLGDPDQSVRADAAVALWKIAGRTEGVTVISDAIYPPIPSSPWWYERLKAVGEMGPAANAAVPNLRRLCNFANQAIREPALEALQKVDPEAAASFRPTRPAPPPASNPGP